MNTGSCIIKNDGDGDGGEDIFAYHGHTSGGKDDQDNHQDDYNCNDDDGGGDND